MFVVGSEDDFRFEGKKLVQSLKSIGRIAEYDVPANSQASHFLPDLCKHPQASATDSASAAQVAFNPLNFSRARSSPVPFLPTAVQYE